MRVAFAMLAVSLLCLAGFTLYEDAVPEWRSHQAEFRRRLGERASEAGREGLGDRRPALEQVFNPAIGAIDRCTTCHAGIADPRFAYAPQPLRSHPDQALVHHDAGAIGCTVCHAGNGQGTTVEGGHGLSDYWERPLRAGVVTQASCGPV